MSGCMPPGGGEAALLLMSPQSLPVMLVDASSTAHMHPATQLKEQSSGDQGADCRPRALPSQLPARASISIPVTLPAPPGTLRAALPPPGAANCCHHVGNDSLPELLGQAVFECWFPRGHF